VNLKEIVDRDGAGLRGRLLGCGGEGLESEKDRRGRTTTKFHLLKAPKTGVKAK
jgi:hypothetical protein